MADSAQAPGEEPPAASEPDAAASAERPSLQEVQGWKGSRLDEMSGSGAGKIEGVYVDSDNGRPEWLLARMGRFGHHSLVPARDAVGGVGHVWVPYDRETIRKAPRVEPGDPLTAERELAFCRHYGIAEGTDRSAELAGRGDAVTARQAE